MILKEEEGKKVTVKDLERDGYQVEAGHPPLSSYKNKTLIDNNITAVGNDSINSNNSLMELLKQKGIDTRLRNKGFKVLRTLSNRSVEYKWITIVE